MAFLMQCLQEATVRNTRRLESFCPEQGSIDFYVSVLLCNWLSSDLLNADVEIVVREKRDCSQSFFLSLFPLPLPLSLFLCLCRSDSSIC